MFIVQSCSRPVNDHLVQLLLLAHSARLASAHRITAVVPWYPYSRQDPEVGRTRADLGEARGQLLEAAGVDRVVTMDLQGGQIQGFFGMPSTT